MASRVSRYYIHRASFVEFFCDDVTIDVIRR